MGSSIIKDVIVTLNLSKKEILSVYWFQNENFYFNMCVSYLILIQQFWIFKSYKIIFLFWKPKVEFGLILTGWSNITALLKGYISFQKLINSWLAELFFECKQYKSIISFKQQM